MNTNIFVVDAKKQLLHIVAGSVPLASPLYNLI